MDATVSVSGPLIYQFTDHWHQPVVVRHTVNTAGFGYSLIHAIIHCRARDRKGITDSLYGVLYLGSKGTHDIG